jgi:hypothetical protein
VISTRAGVGVTTLDGLAQARVLGGEVHPLERVPEEQEHTVGVERLLEEVVRAGLRRLDGRLDRAVPAHHHDQCGRVGLTQAAERVEAVHAGHLHVHEDEVRPEPLVLGEPFRSAGRDAHVVALVLEQLA